MEDGVSEWNGVGEKNWEKAENNGDAACFIMKPAS
jgi:hypothetical protein